MQPSSLIGLRCSCSIVTVQHDAPPILIVVHLAFSRLSPYVAHGPRVFSMLVVKKHKVGQWMVIACFFFFFTLRGYHASYGYIVNYAISSLLSRRRLSLRRVSLFGGAAATPSERTQLSSWWALLFHFLFRRCTIWRIKRDHFHPVGVFIMS